MIANPNVDLNPNVCVDKFMDTMPKWKNMLSVRYVAEKLDVDVKTVKRYIESGKLDAISLPYGKDKKQYKIMKSALQEFLEKDFGDW